MTSQQFPQGFETETKRNVIGKNVGEKLVILGKSQSRFDGDNSESCLSSMFWMILRALSLTADCSAG
jgi:hypothetical protein